MSLLEDEGDDDEGMMLQVQEGLRVVADGNIKEEIIVVEIYGTRLSHKQIWYFL